MNSTRLKEIMSAQSKAGVGRLELNFETAFEVIEALEQAERDLVAVRGSQKKLAKQLVATRTDQGKAEWRADNAEQAIARVHALNNELSWTPNNVAIVQRYRDALDGDGRGQA